MDKGRTTVADLMLKAPALVSGFDTVKTAIELICKHNLRAIPVVEGDRLIGVVTPVRLLQQSLDRMVSEVMVRNVAPAAANLLPAQAETLLTCQGLDVLPVVRDGRVVGLISLAAILEATGQGIDPLTGLPWSTALRAWAGSAIARGHEVAVMFIDLDNYGGVNRTLGYVAGDAILRAVAHILRALINTSTDILCRYGGDEFVIATIRRGTEVKALAHRIREVAMLSVRMRGTRLHLTTNIGVAGGRRSKGRTSHHIAATVDDLLTFASSSARFAKESGRGVAHCSGEVDKDAQRGARRPPDLAGSRLRLLKVTIQEEAHGSTCSVELRLGTQGAVGMASARAHGRALPFLVSEATLRGIPQLIGREYAFTLMDLREVPCENGRLAVVTLAHGMDTPERFVGCAWATDPPYAAARAILDALNRLLSRILARK